MLLCDTLQSSLPVYRGQQKSNRRFFSTLALQWKPFKFRRRQTVKPARKRQETYYSDVTGKRSSSSCRTELGRCVWKNYIYSFLYASAFRCRAWWIMPPTGCENNLKRMSTHLTLTVPAILLVW